MAPVNIRTREGFSLNRSRPLPFGAYFGMLAQLIPTLRICRPIGAGDCSLGADLLSGGRLSCVRYRSRPPPPGLVHVACRHSLDEPVVPQTRTGIYDGPSGFNKNTGM
jgi:hypothetical protein